MNTLNKGKVRSLPVKSINARIVVWSALSLVLMDIVYANLMGINTGNHDALCILKSFMPTWVFLVFKNFVELTVMVLTGVFVSVIIESYFRKIKRFFPKNQLLAFIYGSILPICSCGVIPLIETMKKRVSLRVIVTFVIAAPLLNPYIVVLSLSVMGLKYSIIRIVSSFVLAIASGLMVDWIGKFFFKKEFGKYEVCNANCKATSSDPFIKALQIMKNLLPYILIGGALSLALEIFDQKQILSWFDFSNKWLSMVFMVIIGIPLYSCNGADILILKPLLSFAGLSLGSAMVFSLTASAVCISSIVMLSKFLGRKLTSVLVISVSLISFLIGIVINCFV